MIKKLGILLTVALFTVIMGWVFFSNRAEAGTWCCKGIRDGSSNCNFDSKSACEDDPKCATPQEGTCAPNSTGNTGTPEPKKATFAGEDTQKFTITNPLACDTATCLVQRFIDQLNRFAAIIIVIVFFWSAIQFAIGSSLGDDKKISQAKSTLFWGIIGYAIILISKGAVDIITSILKID